MAICPTCESSYTGAKCACGYQPPALTVGPSPGGLRWHLCEWLLPGGRTCHVPTGTLGAEGMQGRLLPPRLCAYHRERERMTLFGEYVSEQKAFLDWVARYPPGVRSQPAPGIWDLDRAMLWLLVDGAMSWEEFRAWMKSQTVRA